MQFNTAFSFPADAVSLLSSPTPQQRRKWADMALAIIFDEAGVSPKGWRRHDKEPAGVLALSLIREHCGIGMSCMSRANPKEHPEYQEQGLRWYAEVRVSGPNNTVKFTVEGDDEVGNALREAAVRLGWGS